MFSVVVAGVLSVRRDITRSMARIGSEGLAGFGTQ